MRGRQKERNIRANPKVGLAITDPDNPYHYVSIDGVVENVTEEGAVENVHHIARKYMDVDKYPHLEEEPEARVIVVIKPETIRIINEPERKD